MSFYTRSPLSTTTITTKYQPPSPSRFLASIPIVSSLYSSWGSSRPQPFLPAFHSFEEPEPEDDDAPYPALPNELVHLIFTFAASESTRACQTLCLVSSWTRRIVLPFLMQTIVVLDNSHFLLNEEEMEDGWRSPTWYTKNLWIDDAVVEPDLERIFRRCPNISKLALSGRNLQKILEGHSHQTIRSERIDLLIHSIATSEQGNLLQAQEIATEYFGHPFLDKVTSLTLGHIVDTTKHPVNISSFPRLTRVTLRFYGVQSSALRDLVSFVRTNAQLEQINIALPPLHLIPRPIAESLLEVVKEQHTADHRVVQSTMTNLSWIAWKVEAEGRDVVAFGEIFKAYKTI